DAVAARVDVPGVVVLVVELEALVLRLVALREARVQVLAVPVPLRVQVVVEAVVEAPPGEAELELVGIAHPPEVARQLRVELGVVEVPVLSEVTRAVRRRAQARGRAARPIGGGGQGSQLRGSTQAGGEDSLPFLKKFLP